MDRLFYLNIQPDGRFRRDGQYPTLPADVDAQIDLLRRRRYTDNGLLAGRRLIRRSWIRRPWRSLRYGRRSRSLCDRPPCGSRRAIHRRSDRRRLLVY